MRKREPFTEADRQWLKENWGTHTKKYCRGVLRCSYDAFNALICELGLPPKLVKKAEERKTKFPEWMDANSKGCYCIDCENCVKGEWCSKYSKPVGALWMKKCFKGEVSSPSQKSKIMEKTKVCSKCGRELPTEEFHNNPRSKDGKMSLCKECHSACAKMGGRKKRVEDAPEAEQPMVEQPKAESPRVKAVRAIGKVHTPEEIGAWLEVNKSYKMFLKYFSE
jgi:hypothetical protein